MDFPGGHKIRQSISMRGLNTSYGSWSYLMVGVYELVEEEELEVGGRVGSLSNNVGEMGILRHICSAFCAANFGGLVANCSIFT